MKVSIVNDSGKREYVTYFVVVTSPEFENGHDFDLGNASDSALFQFLRHSAEGIGCDSEPCSIVDAEDGIELSCEFKLHTAAFCYADAFAKGMCAGFDSVESFPNRYASAELGNAFRSGLLAAEKAKVRPGTNFAHRLEKVKDEAVFNLKFTWRA